MSLTCSKECFLLSNYYMHQNMKQEFEAHDDNDIYQAQGTDNEICLKVLTIRSAWQIAMTITPCPPAKCRPGMPR